MPRSRHTRDEAATYHEAPSVPASEHIAPELSNRFSKHVPRDAAPDDRPEPDRAEVTEADRQAERMERREWETENDG